MLIDSCNKTHLKVVMVTMQRYDGSVNVDRSQHDSPHVSGSDDAAMPGLCQCGEIPTTRLTSS